MSSPIGSARLERVQAALEAHVAHGAACGAVALVGDGATAGTVLVGSQSTGRADPIRRDTVFRIASLTKPVTAVAALLLIEDGRLALDAPVARWLPELADPRVLNRLDAPLDDTHRAARPITVEDLLSLRLGIGLVLAPPATYPIQRAITELGLVGFGPPDPAAPLDPDEWLRRLGTLPLMADPGERWLYTTGSNVLGVLIARAAGQPLPQFLQQRLFEPLGMVDTAFHVPPAKLGRFAAAYRPGAAGLELYESARDSAWGRAPAFPAGDSGLVSTADDLFAFARLLLTGGMAGSRRLLSAASVAQMLRDHLTPAQRAGGAAILGATFGWGYGLGVTLAASQNGLPVGCAGWCGGLGTSWQIDPASGRCAILLTQTLFASPEPPPIHADFWRIAFGPARD